MSDVNALAEALGAPFEPSEIHFKPQAVSGSRCLAIAYVDARTVMDRLDAAAGADNWKDHYEILPDGNAKCTLSLRVGGEWIAREDVGSPSEQPDDGDRCKAAVSDGLKRAAVKWGVGRYLYRLPGQWVDYDPQRRQIVSPPRLPAWALPGGGKEKPAHQQQAARVTRPARKDDARTPLEQAKATEALWVGQGWIAEGDLINHLEVTLGDGWDGHAPIVIRKVMQHFRAERKPAERKLVVKAAGEGG